MDTKERDIYIEMHREYYDILVAWCKNFVHYDTELVQLAEDWVQETFYRALKDPDKFLSHNDKFRWMKVTCRHVAESAMQRLGVKKRRTAIYMDTLISPKIEDTAARIERWTEINAAESLLDKVLYKLSPMERDICTDVFVHGMKEADAAAKHNKSIAAIKASIRRIRRKANRYKIFK